MNKLKSLIESDISFDLTKENQDYILSSMGIISGGKKLMDIIKSSPIDQALVFDIGTTIGKELFDHFSDNTEEYYGCMKRIYPEIVDLCLGYDTAVNNVGLLNTKMIELNNAISEITGDIGTGCVSVIGDDDGEMEESDTLFQFSFRILRECIMRMELKESGEVVTA